MRKLSPLLIVMVAILSACSSKVDVAVDNPSKEEVSMYIDSLHVVVPPKEVVWVEMGKGSHSVTVDGEEPVDYDFQKKFYMLNPTQSEYLMYEEIYGTGMVTSIIPSQPVTYMGLDLGEMEMQVVKDLVNEVTWDYGPRETLPEMIEYYEGDRPTLVKLMDYNEFFEAMSQAADAE